MAEHNYHDPTKSDAFDYQAEQILGTPETVAEKIAVAGLAEELNERATPQADRPYQLDSNGKVVPPEK